MLKEKSKKISFEDTLKQLIGYTENQIEKCYPEPSSKDIPYWKLWKEQWHDLDMNLLTDIWEH